jgi:hypothetical protein
MPRRSVIGTSALATVAAGIVGLVPASAAPNHTVSTQAAQANAWLQAAVATTIRASHGAAIRIGPDANNRSAEQQAQIVPAGHLGGRKHPVVLDIRDTDPGFEPGTVGITARSGLTGKSYWSKTYSQISGDTQLVVMVEPVGPHGTPGLVVVHFTSTPDVTPPDTDEDMTITAYAGSTGKQLWSTPFDGVYDPNLQESSNVAVGAMPIHDAHRKTVDVLVPTRTSLGGGDQQTQGHLVSGINGTTSMFAGPYTATNAFPTEAVVPDLNRDGLQDVVVVSPNSFVRALNGANPSGTALWTASLGFTGLASVTAIPNYSHGSIPDLALATVQNGDEHLTYHVLSGARGHLLWTRKADALLLVHKAGPKLVPAVVLASRSSTESTHRDTATWHYAAITPANKVLYSKQLTGTISSTGPLGGLNETISTMGDVNGDGAMDIHVTIDGVFPPVSAILSAGSAAKPDLHIQDGIINARSGAFHPVVFQAAADGSLQQGARVDLLAAEAFHGHTRLTTRRGSTRKAYYTESVTTLTGTAAAWATGLRVSGHSCSDIALVARTKPPPPTAIASAAATPQREESAILTARGARLWTVTYPIKDATGGTLVQHKRPKHFCV